MESRNEWTSSKLVCGGMPSSKRKCTGKRSGGWMKAKREEWTHRGGFSVRMEEEVAVLAAD